MTKPVAVVYRSPSGQEYAILYRWNGDVLIGATATPLGRVTERSPELRWREPLAGEAATGVIAVGEGEETR